jgi:hypothetical protein
MIDDDFICFTTGISTLCAPPAPRDPAPLCFRPAQARLNFGSVLLTLLTLLTAPWRSQEPILLQILNF